MTRYLLYFLTGVAIASVILFFRGYVAVPHTVYSDVALRAGMLLFGMASWLTLFRIKAGSLLALLCLLAVVPWLVRIGLRVWSPGADVLQAVLILHAALSVLALASLTVSARYTLGRSSWKAGTASPGLMMKVILAAIPVAVVAAWIAVMQQV
ncbi:hypothetical protein I2I11_07405 [Pontibacter sp. 172403-2]|uniref:hypothetical protein n=1 Tax=Pontibacter rufus TaxID=2791028 RepID=UPI0018AF5BB5|nr:hypothetical protein [Pontibacter sp. 172403-2]MBF9253114.1 hypothetical protein [Pontibacter sp. 172403-2]